MCLISYERKTKHDISEEGKIPMTPNCMNVRVKQRSHFVKQGETERSSINKCFSFKLNDVHSGRQDQ